MFFWALYLSHAHNRFFHSYPPQVYFIHFSAEVMCISQTFCSSIWLKSAVFCGFRLLEEMTLLRRHWAEDDDIYSVEDFLMVSVTRCWLTPMALPILWSCTREMWWTVSIVLVLAKRIARATCAIWDLKSGGGHSTHGHSPFSKIKGRATCLFWW